MSEYVRTHFGRKRRYIYGADGRLKKAVLLAPREPLLTYQDLAAHLQVCPGTVSRYVKQGMPAVRLGHRARLVRFRLSDVTKWLKEINREEPAEEGA